MNLQLVTILGEKFNEAVYEVILPTASGEISVFPSHESLVTLARPGVIAVRRSKLDPDDALEYFATSGGVIEIDPDRVRILVDEADHGDDIIEAESQKALERALKMQANASNQVELEEASALVDKHQTRLKVAGLRRHKNRVQYK
jgi:F-type H+-transporting ATPase subunit epsilon